MCFILTKHYRYKNKTGYFEQALQIESSLDSTHDLPQIADIETLYG